VPLQFCHAARHEAEYATLTEQIYDIPFGQGGPHQHTIAGISVALKEAMSAEFKQYQQQIVHNCKALADELIRR
jgi:glycine/serine hydroxymethyltransferase